MFDELTPGAELAAALAAVEPAGLGLEGALDVIVAAERLVAWASAVQAEAINRVLAARPTEAPGFDPVVEIAAAFGWSIHATSFRASFAAGLDRLPATATALRAGDIDLARARKFVDGTAYCPAEVGRAVENELIPLAPRLSPTQLARRIARLIATLDPHETERRHCERRRDRQVEFSPGADGIGWLSLYGPVDKLAEAMSAISGWALHHKRGGATGTLDGLRFDAAIALLTGTLTGQPSTATQVHVTVPIGTLIGTADAPGEISGTGYGPVTVPASVARRLAADAGEWIRILTDPVTGQICSHHRTRYRPTPTMRATIALRDQHCRAPGCDAPVWRCDADHTRNYPDGPTCECNLTLFCRRHHNAKTHGGWIASSSGHDGVLTMTSPLGKIYTTTPDPPADADPPANADPPADPDPLVDLVTYHHAQRRLRALRRQLAG